MGSSPLIFSTFKHHVKLVQEIFKKQCDLFGWSKRKNMKILDVGIGAGKSLSVIEPMLSPDYAEIVCVDKDPEMCKYFDSLEKDPRISTRQLNIETENLPNDLKGRFDFLMSVYCFQYVLNFRQAFKNTSQLVKPNGELFFMWSKKNQFFETYRTLSQTEKWAPYVKEFKNWTNLFDDDKATETAAKELDRVGLKILKIEEFGEVVFRNENAQAWLDAFNSIDMVSGRIPKIDLPNYQKDFDKLMLQYVIEDKIANNSIVRFPTIVVVAKKVV